MGNRGRNGGALFTAIAGFLTYAVAPYLLIATLGIVDIYRPIWRPEPDVDHYVLVHELMAFIGIYLLPLLLPLAYGVFLICRRILQLHLQHPIAVHLLAGAVSGLVFPSAAALMLRGPGANTENLGLLYVTMIAAVVAAASGAAIYAFSGRHR
ncbi:MAG: hypothetical protein JJ900_16845 [Rhodospirillales bacterium]|nr:hypothetical protein [Rhodospirillales bacterium]MBO6788517.1 hypothetical protein [Rhodospirillales bacterium]